MTVIPLRGRAPGNRLDAAIKQARWEIEALLPMTLSQRGEVAAIFERLADAIDPDPIDESAPPGLA
jgi:hypothetical protein